MRLYARLSGLVAVLAVSLLTPVTADAAAAPTTMPTITSPEVGITVTTPSVTFEVTSSAAFVEFNHSMTGGGGTTTVPVSGGKASVTADLIGFGGWLYLNARDCSSVGVCSDDYSSQSWSVDQVDPQIVSPTRNQVFGDLLVVEATAPAGAVEFRLDGPRKAVDLEAPYKAAIDISGKKDGTYRAWIRQCTDDGSVCEGDYDSVQFIKDTVGPTWSDPKASRPTVYPKDDQYLDVVTLSSRVSESVYGTIVEVRRVDGPVVRTLTIGDRRSGVISRNWDGRNDAGTIVADGRYEFRFIGDDIHAVQGSSEPGFVRVSDQELVRRTFTKQVTAAGSGIADISGDCSRVGRTSRWKGALGWRSNYSRTCSGSDAVAASVHGARLDNIDQAIRLVALRVSAYGGQAPRTRSQATMFYVKPNGDLAAQHALDGRVRWHAGDRTALEPFVNRTRVRWVVATRNGNWYDIKGFKVSYTVMVLR